MTSNTEINFQRLLNKCEELAVNQKTSDWRFEKYVDSLDDLLKNLSKAITNKLPQHTLKEYFKRVEVLKELSTHHKPTNSQVTVSTVINTAPLMNTTDTKTKQIYQQLQINQENQLRNELFGATKSTSVDTNEKVDMNNSNLDIDKLLIEQQKEQDKVAEEMIEIASRIKENSKAANTILKHDNTRLDVTNKIAEKNSTNLNIENERVNKNLKRCFNWWIYLMVILVFIVFIMMVLFMKIFPKRKYYNEPIADIKFNNNIPAFSQLNSTMSTPVSKEL